MANQQTNNIPEAHDDDRMVLTARGACLVAAQAYADRFGPDPDGRSVIEIADDMVRRLFAA